MDVIPVLRLKQQLTKKGNDLAFIREQMDNHSLSTLYIIDELGIFRNHPQVDFYQKISKIYEIWVDAGPRDAGDIVDIVFAGAANIVLRPSTWVEPDVRTIRDMTEHRLFCHYDVQVSERQVKNTQHIPTYDFDGTVVFLHGDWEKRRFTSEETIKKLAKNENSFVYASTSKDQSFWRDLGFDAILVDLDTFPEGS